MRPVYSAEDLAELHHLDSTPGRYPFVRGPRASMFLGRPWTIRQYAGFSTAAESNAFYRQALAEGQRGVDPAGQEREERPAAERADQPDDGEDRHPRGRGHSAVSSRTRPYFSIFLYRFDRGMSMERAVSLTFHSFSRSLPRM